MGLGPPSRRVIRPASIRSAVGSSPPYVTIEPLPVHARRNRRSIAQPPDLEHRMHPSLPVRRRALPAALLLVLLGAPLLSSAAEADLAAIQRTVTAQHDVSLKRLQFLYRNFHQ